MAAPARRRAGRSLADPIHLRDHVVSQRRACSPIATCCSTPLRLGASACVGDRYFSPRPFFHVAGSTLSVIASLQHCACLVTIERFEAGDALRLIEEERCTFISGNDTIFLMLLDHPDLATRNLSLRGGWAAATPSVMERIMRQLGAAETSVCYGLSEASPNIGVSAWWDPVEDRIAGRMRLHPGVEVEIRSTEDGAECSARMRSARSRPAAGTSCAAITTSPTRRRRCWTMTAGCRRAISAARCRWPLRLRRPRQGHHPGRRRECRDRRYRECAAPASGRSASASRRRAGCAARRSARRLRHPIGRSVAPAEEIISWSKERLASFKVPRYVEIVGASSRSA